MFDDELKTIDKTIVSCANADILASAPEAAGVRVWYLNVTALGTLLTNWKSQRRSYSS